MFGKIKQIISAKEKVWEGTSVEQFELCKSKLKSQGIYIQAFKVNQETPKCDGKCGSCLSRCNFEDDTKAYEKIGTGISDNLLKDKPAFDLYHIYVMEKDVDQAKQILENEG